MRLALTSWTGFLSLTLFLTLMSPAAWALKTSNSKCVRALVEAMPRELDPQDILRVYSKVQSATGMFDKYMGLIMEPLIQLGLRDEDVDRAIYLNAWIRLNIFSVETSMNVDHNMMLAATLLLERVPDSKLHKVVEIFNILRAIDDFYEAGDLILLLRGVVSTKVDRKTAWLAKQIYVELRRSNIDAQTAARWTLLRLGEETQTKAGKFK